MVGVDWLVEGVVPGGGAVLVGVVPGCVGLGVGVAVTVFVAVGVTVAVVVGVTVTVVVGDGVVVEVGVVVTVVEEGVMVTGMVIVTVIFAEIAIAWASGCFWKIIRHQSENTTISIESRPANRWKRARRTNRRRAGLDAR
jgi:hypothetical protein